MFIIEESDSILVYDNKGKLRYKSINIVQYKKFNQDSLAVITDTSIDFISQIINKDGSQDILVTIDTDYVSAMIQEDLLFVQRKIMVPILDVYNQDFNNMLRLYQNTKGEWVHFIVKFGIPYKAMIPTHLKGKMLFGKRGDKACAFNLEQRDFQNVKIPKDRGIPLQGAIKKFKVEIAV